MSANQPEIRVRAVKILAHSIYKDLLAQGFDDRQVISLATELISEVTESMAGREQVRSTIAAATPAVGLAATPR